LQFSTPTSRATSWAWASHLRRVGSKIGCAVPGREKVMAPGAWREPAKLRKASLTDLLAVLHHALLGRWGRRSCCGRRRWGRSTIRHWRRRPTDHRGRRRPVDDGRRGRWPVDVWRSSVRFRRWLVHDLLRRRARRALRGRRRAGRTNRWPRWRHAWSLRQGSGRRTGPRRCPLRRGAWPNGGGRSTGTRQARSGRAARCCGW
jgi:hypothetical protein